jgi:pyruvate dehydrogenase E1 component alpha subunit
MPQSEVASFTVSHLQVVDEEGRVDAALEPALEPEQLLGIYRAMVRAREADQRMLKLQRQGRLGTFPPCTGQEAVSVGAAFAMGERDWMVPAYRELGGRLARGEPLDLTLTYYNGYEEGSHYPVERRILPTQVILGSQVPHAVGLAYAMRYQGEEDTAVVCFNGDGATSQGDFHEGLNFAGVWRAPVVFICQNNGWAISIPRSAQTGSATIAQKAIAYGFPGVQVDGNDVLAVYRATSEALARARAGEGPTLIEAVTYRLMMHTTADDPKKYRGSEEEERWWARDPIPRFRRYLEGKGLWDDDRQQALLDELKREVDEAVQRVEQMAVGRDGVKPDAPFDHVYGTENEEVAAQRAAFLDELKLEGAHG